MVPTLTFNEATLPFYEEADLIEEWCEESTTDKTADIIREAGLACMGCARNSGIETFRVNGGHCFSDSRRLLLFSWFRDWVLAVGWAYRVSLS